MAILRSATAAWMVVVVATALAWAQFDIQRNKKKHRNQCELKINKQLMIEWGRKWAREKNRGERQSGVSCFLTRRVCLFLLNGKLKRKLFYEHTHTHHPADYLLPANNDRSRLEWFSKKQNSIFAIKIKGFRPFLIDFRFSWYYIETLFLETALREEEAGQKRGFIDHRRREFQVIDYFFCGKLHISFRTIWFSI
jgi:hypothetical protein